MNGAGLGLPHERGPGGHHVEKYLDTVPFLYFQTRMIAKAMELKQEPKNEQVTGSPPPPSASPVLQQSSPQQEEHAPVMLTTMQPVPLSASEIHSYGDDRQFIYQVDGKHVEFVRQVRKRTLRIRGILQKNLLLFSGRSSSGNRFGCRLRTGPKWLSTNIPESRNHSACSFGACRRLGPLQVRLL